jgi:hypothetical protein
VTKLAEAIRQAAEQGKRARDACEPIFAELGYSEFPPEHVMETVIDAIERASVALGTDRERIELFRVRKIIEEKRAMVVSEEERCVTCGEPRAFADEQGICPECLS